MIPSPQKEMKASCCLHHFEPLESVGWFCCDCEIYKVSLEFLFFIQKEDLIISKCTIVSLKGKGVLTKTDFLRRAREV